MQKKPPQDDCESDVSCSSLMSGPRCLELTASCANDSSQAHLNRPHSNLSRERLHLRKLKPSKRPRKSKSSRSKNSGAPQKPAVVMKHLICTSHCGSGSSQESRCQEFQHAESVSSEKEKTSCDPVHYSEEQEHMSTTATHSLCLASQLSSEENTIAWG